MRLVWGNQDESATFLTAKPPVKTSRLMTQLRRQRRQSSTEHSPGQKALSAVLPQRWARVVKPKSFSAQPKDVAVVALQRKKGSVCLIWGRSRFALHHSWQAPELLLPSLLWSRTCWASAHSKMQPRGTYLPGCDLPCRWGTASQFLTWLKPFTPVCYATAPTSDLSFPSHGEFPYLL